MSGRAGVAYAVGLAEMDDMQLLHEMERLQRWFDDNADEGLRLSHGKLYGMEFDGNKRKQEACKLIAVSRGWIALG